MTGTKAAQKHGQARRDELRAEVLAVVERHLRAGTTFADLSVADVVAEAGISRSTFYAYFVDKPNLLRSWYDEFTDGGCPGSRGFSGGGPPPGDCRGVGTRAND